MISGPATSGATFFGSPLPSGNKQHKTHPAQSEELATDGDGWRRMKVDGYQFPTASIRISRDNQLPILNLQRAITL